MPSQRLRFQNSEGHTLVGYLDLPETQSPRAYALFAHCFTCGKNLKPIKNINTALAGNDIAVLRFDFTGIGESQGDFSDTNFSTNIDDLVAAADFLAKEYDTPKLLIGHSMGGAAVLQAARQIASVTAVTTIAAPSSPDHLGHILQEKREVALDEGSVDVTIGGRTFHLRRQFFRDLEKHQMEKTIRELDKPLLILHSSGDKTVDIRNAEEIFAAARQPKSFVSLDPMDHLMLDKADAHYVGNLIAAWAARFL